MGFSRSNIAYAKQTQDEAPTSRGVRHEEVRMFALLQVLGGASP